jgi:hypothetical protein
MEGVSARDVGYHKNGNVQAIRISNSRSTMLLNDEVSHYTVRICTSFFVAVHLNFLYPKYSFPSS